MPSKFDKVRVVSYKDEFHEKISAISFQRTEQTASIYRINIVHLKSTFSFMFYNLFHYHISTLICRYVQQWLFEDFAIYFIYSVSIYCNAIIE